MKHAITVLAVLLLAAGIASAASLPADVIYVEGTATTRRASGKAGDLSIGDRLSTGDSVRTGKDGRVELDQKGLAIKISPNTVFTLMERESGGKQTGVLAVTLGAVKVRYAKLTGQEPMIQTVSCVAGVRGTELEIFAGADGTSLFVVAEGLVTVEAGGRAVDLGPLEAVEVRNGQAPGEKFTVQRDQIDYRKWSEGRLEQLLADPLATVDGLRARLAEYARNVGEYRALYGELSTKLKEERAQLAQILEEKGREEAEQYEKEVIGPLTVRAGNTFLNFRHFLLAALSMRRFVGGRVYLLLKMSHLSDTANPAWTGFLERYRQFLAEFEETIAPQLSEVDI